MTNLEIGWQVYTLIVLSGICFFMGLWVFHLREDLARIRRDRDEYKDTTTNTSAQNVVLQSRIQVLESSVNRQNETIRRTQNNLIELADDSGEIRWNELAEAANDWDEKKKRERIETQVEADKAKSKRFDKLLTD